MRVSALKWGLNQPYTMSLNQFLSIFIFFLPFLHIFKEGQKQGEITDFGGGVSKQIFFFAQSAPNLATPLEKVIPIRFQASVFCKTRFTHRGPLLPPDQTKIAPKKRDFGANYNVKLSTSKMQNRPELIRSHKPPNQVVRMLVLSMKNNI